MQQLLQVAYLLLYGNLPSAKELARFEEAVARHSAVPASVEEAIKALPHDAHFMGSILVGINALSTCHPEQNPALAGQDVYKSKEIQDKQIVRLIGTLTQTMLLKAALPKLMGVTVSLLWSADHDDWCGKCLQVAHVGSGECCSR